MDIYRWSKTPSSNANADPDINWTEGQAANTVNDSARAMMASIAAKRDDDAGLVTTGGSGNAYTISALSSVIDIYRQGLEFAVTIDRANTGAATLAIGLLTALPWRKSDGSEYAAGELQPNCVARVRLNSTATRFETVGLSLPAPFGASGANHFAGLVPDPGATAGSMRVLREDGGWNTVPVFGASGTNHAPGGVPDPGATAGTQRFLSEDASWKYPTFIAGEGFRALKISVISNTQVWVLADALFLGNGAGRVMATGAFSQTVNTFASGANGLDSGSISPSTWYHVWAIAKDDGTVSALISSSYTAPTMPTGYTFRYRVGAVRTDGSSQLFRTLQFGRRAVYVIGASNLPASPTIYSGSTGGALTAVSVVSFVPPTASSVTVNIRMFGANATVGAAPNMNYSGVISSNIYTSQGIPIAGLCSTLLGSNIIYDMVLESMNIYYVSGMSTAGIYCMGWEDNL